MRCAHGHRRGRPPKREATSRKLRVAERQLSGSIDAYLIAEKMWHDSGHGQWAFGLALWCRIDAREKASEVVKLKSLLAIAD